MPKKSSQIRTPGPADYSVRPLVGFIDHSDNSRRPRAPQWSIGQKLGTRKTLKTPGPASYDVKRELNQHGRYCPIALSIPIKFKAQTTGRTPGPTYNATDVALYRWNYGPKFTIASRYGSKAAGSSTRPGPATYEPTSIDLIKQNSPRFTIAGKRRSSQAAQTPGPKYDVYDAMTKTLRTAPAYTHRWRAEHKRWKLRTPGPNAYDLSKYNPFAADPAYTIAQRTSFQPVNVLRVDNCYSANANCCSVEFDKAFKARKL